MKLVYFVQFFVIVIVLSQKQIEYKGFFVGSNECRGDFYSFYFTNELNICINTTFGFDDRYYCKNNEIFLSRCTSNCTIGCNALRTNSNFCRPGNQFLPTMYYSCGTKYVSNNTIEIFLPSTFVVSYANAYITNDYCSNGTIFTCSEKFISKRTWKNAECQGNSELEMLYYANSTYGLSYTLFNIKGIKLLGCNGTSYPPYIPNTNGSITNHCSINMFIVILYIFFYSFGV